MHRHLLAERRHPLWEGVTSRPAQALDPGAQRVSRGVVEPFDFLRRELAGQLERRQPRRVQDLVRVRVPNAREQARIGEGALERVRLACQRRSERPEVGCEHVDAAGVVGGESQRATREIEGGAVFAAGLGEEQCAAGKIERRESQPSRDRSAGRFPPQPARDHEMQDDEVVVVEAEHDALAEPREAPDHAARELLGTRLDRAE